MQISTKTNTKLNSQIHFKPKSTALSVFLAPRPFQYWTGIPQLWSAHGPLPIWESAPVQPPLLPPLSPSALPPCHQPPVPQQPGHGPQQPGGYDPHQPTAAERSLPVADQRPEEHGRLPGAGICLSRPFVFWTRIPTLSWRSVWK